MLPEEKKRVAYHEAGHALVACSLPNSDPYLQDFRRADAFRALAREWHLGPSGLA